ncbi:MAG: small multi-drug export protein [Ruminococcaceae bacterium]|nr:small multi-drug export protein [Oscillospiraceae bacterium]MBD8962605.1 small multi-drug export protein [Oscillospiraceae bacterium]
MTDQIIQSIVTFFQDKIPNELTVFIISVLPVLELRGGLIAAKLLDMSIIRAFIVCYLGNMLPIPFILLFLRKIFDLMRKSKKLGKIVGKLEHKAEKHRKTIDKYGAWGLLVLVAIPLPGTGGWTGALVAEIMDIKFKKALPIIALGVLIAGFIVGALFYGLLGNVI